MTALPNRGPFSRTPDQALPVLDQPPQRRHARRHQDRWSAVSPPFRSSSLRFPRSRSGRACVAAISSSTGRNPLRCEWQSSDLRSARNASVVIYAERRLPASRLDGHRGPRPGAAMTKAARRCSKWIPRRPPLQARSRLPDAFEIIGIADGQVTRTARDPAIRGVTSWASRRSARWSSANHPRPCPAC